IANALFPETGAKSRSPSNLGPGSKAGPAAVSRLRSDLDVQDIHHAVNKRALGQYPAIVAVMCLLAVWAVGQTVTVNDSFFNPNTLAITAGQSVTWSWGGGTGLFHNVHSGTTNGTSCFPGGPLNSGATQNSGTYGPIQFTVAGTYPYFCD